MTAGSTNLPVPKLIRPNRQIGIKFHPPHVPFFHFEGVFDVGRGHLAAGSTGSPTKAARPQVLRGAHGRLWSTRYCSWTTHERVHPSTLQRRCQSYECARELSIVGAGTWLWIGNSTRMCVVRTDGSNDGDEAVCDCWARPNAEGLSAPLLP